MRDGHLCVKVRLSRQYTSYYLLLATCYLLLATYYLLLTTYCLLLTAYQLLLTCALASAAYVHVSQSVH